MSNLLDKSSIVLTASAYDNGKVLCVKPSDGSGDFDFSRNSAATRVNAQGLVEDVQILSSNLVQNGDFSEQGAEEVSNGSFSQLGSEQITNGDFATDSIWTFGTGWSISGGTANCDGTQTGNSGLVQQGGILGATINFVVGKTYKVNFDVVVTSGVITMIEVASGVDLNSITASGNHTTYITAVSTNNRFTILANPSFIGSVTNVSVKEVGQNWEFGVGWGLGENKAISTGSQILSQPFTHNNKIYKYSFEVTDYISGNLRFRIGNGATEIIVSSNGVFTGVMQSAGGLNKIIFGDTGIAISCSVTNISVKEVGQNWILGGSGDNTPTIGLNSATIAAVDGNSFIQQSNILVSGKSYKITYTINSSSGSSVLKLISSFGLATIPTTVGTHTVYGTATTSALYIERAITPMNATITNISLIEITDDTNLPRINYEGFSYQDALGSEEIVNGNFATDLSGWTLSSSTPPIWDNKMMKMTSDGVTFSRADQSFVTKIGVEYKFEINKLINSNSIQVKIGNGIGNSNVLNQTLSSVDKYTFTITPTSTNTYIRIEDGSGTEGAYVSDISVKEYFGQEVVPDSGCGSWLWENQSTNLIPYSNDYSQSVWRKRTSDSTQVPVITNNYAISPDGTQNASRVVITKPSTDNDYAVLDNYISVARSIGDKLTSTIYIKANSSAQVGKEVNLYAYDGSYLTMITYALTDSWVRIDAVHTSTTATSFMEAIVIGKARSSVGGVSLANMATDFLISFAQLENQSYATSYIPTDGTSVTRNQDVCTNGGSVSTINSTEGVLYAEIKSFITQDTVNPNRYITLTNDTSNERVALLLGGNSNQLRAIIFSSTQSINLSFTTSLTEVKQFNKLAIKYKSGDYAFFLNGIKIGGSTETNIFSSNTLNDLSFDVGGGTQKFFGKTKALAVWKEALSDEELAELTTI